MREAGGKGQEEGVRRHFVPHAEHPFIERTNASGLRIQLHRSGRLFAIRHGATLINQFLPTAAERGWTRLWLRDRKAPATADLLAGRFDGNAWHTDLDGLAAEAELLLHATDATWFWRVRVRNTRATAAWFDLVHGQDVGLASEAAVRMNEAYLSQYLDHTILRHRVFRAVIATRQNQAQDGRNPWLAQGCLDGAVAWSTDGCQVFRTPGDECDALPVRDPSASLECRNLQYEFAWPALQTSAVTLAPGASTSFTFFAVYQPHHPDATEQADVDRLGELEPAGRTASVIEIDPAVLLFDDTTTLAVREDAGEATFAEGPLHTVPAAKERAVERPHGHILRTGSSLWLDDETLGTTVYANGLFNAQVYLGNTNLARLLSVVRNPLGLHRAAGQRIFVRISNHWKRLGIPTRFEMGLRHARWTYVGEGFEFDVTTRAAEDEHAIATAIEVKSGGPLEFLITHLLVMGEAEMSQPFSVAFDPTRAAVTAQPSPKWLLGEKWPDLRFEIVADDPTSIAELGGDELLFADGRSRNAPFAVFRTAPVNAVTLTLRAGRKGSVRPARNELPQQPRLRHPLTASLDAILPWFQHDAWIHFSAPHGLEQYGGAAWGTRDVCQGPVEWLLAARRYPEVRRILLKVFAQQYEDGNWPQWFMFDPFRFIQHPHSHGDIVFWPLKALADYIEASGDTSILAEPVCFTDTKTFADTQRRATILEHADLIVAQHEARRIPGTALVNYGDGDWDDTLQPADPRLRASMVSAWTVALAYDTFARFAAVCERAGHAERAVDLRAKLAAIRTDFNRLLMPDGIAAGFAVFEPDGIRPLLHPRDQTTGIRYRLLPMTRSILADLFTPEQARQHLDLIREHLLCPDGVRLMSDPVPYRGGVERWFKRAETAANFGREIGLMYVHAHLRYAEALARVGDGEGLWHALQVVNPAALAEAVPNAALRQANAYFSSSDGAFADRYEAAKRFGELRDGTVRVRGGWRVYSSGPGLFLHRVTVALLGWRDSFGDVVIDPVLPRCLDGLVVELDRDGRKLEVRYRVTGADHGPTRIAVNGAELDCSRRDGNPHRTGGVRVPAETFDRLLTDGLNRIDVEV